MENWLWGFRIYLGGVLEEGSNIWIYSSWEFFRIEEGCEFLREMVFWEKF